MFSRWQKRSRSEDQKDRCDQMKQMHLQKQYFPVRTRCNRMSLQPYTITQSLTVMQAYYCSDLLDNVLSN